MMCQDCIDNTGSYNMKCIGCYARWIMQFDKPERLKKIEQNGRHDVEELKAEIMRIAK